MKRAIIFVALIFLCSSFVLAAVPTTTPHGFHGEVYYSDGTPINKNLEIRAEINGNNYTSVLNEGKYDLVVEGKEGDKIYFYIEGLANSIGNYEFKSFEITEINFTTSLVNPNQDSTSTGSSSSSSSSSGGGGSSGSSSTTPNDEGVIMLDNSEETNNETNIELSENSDTNSKITGGVIGFVKSGKGIISLAFIILVVAVGIVVQKRKKISKNE